MVAAKTIQVGRAMGLYSCPLIAVYHARKVIWVCNLIQSIERVYFKIKFPMVT